MGGDTWAEKWYEIVGKREIGFDCLFTEMLLGVLRYIDFTMSLSKSLMWHLLIAGCKPKSLLNLISYIYIYIYIMLELLDSLCFENILNI